MTLLSIQWEVPFAAFFAWLVPEFFMARLGIGNLNAVALEPMGHMAGLAASIISATSIVAPVLIAGPNRLAIDGTPLPTALGILGVAIATLTLISRINNTKLSDEPRHGGIALLCLGRPQFCS